MPSLNTGNAILSNPIKVDSSYNVGIGGAASGSYKLQVTGTANFTSDVFGLTGFYTRNSTDTFIGSTNNTSGIIVNGTTLVTKIVSGGNTVATFANAGAATFSSSVAATTGTFSTSATTVLSMQSTGTASGLQLRNTGGTTSDWIIQSDGGAVAGQAALRFYSITASAYRMSIDGSGNVGIGTSSPTNFGAANTALTINGAGGNAGLLCLQANGADGMVVYSDGNGTTNYESRNLYMRFGTNNTERMRITSGGQLYFSRNSGGTDVINIEAYTGFTGRGILLNMDAGSDAITIGGGGSQNAINVTNSSKKVIISNLGGSGTVTVQADNSGTLIKSSDSSLKQEDKEYKIQGLAEILQLQPRAYKWLKDIEIRKEEAVTEIGFFADEVNPIIPSAAPKGFDGLYGFNDRAVTAALVKAIQELNQTVQNQQQQINSLINR